MEILLYEKTFLLACLIFIGCGEPSPKRVYCWHTIVYDRNGQVVDEWTEKGGPYSEPHTYSRGNWLEYSKNGCDQQIEGGRLSRTRTIEVEKE